MEPGYDLKLNGYQGCEYWTPEYNSCVDNLKRELIFYRGETLSLTWCLGATGGFLAISGVTTSSTIVLKRKVGNPNTCYQDTVTIPSDSPTGMYQAAVGNPSEQRGIYFFIAEGTRPPDVPFPIIGDGGGGGDGGGDGSGTGGDNSAFWLIAAVALGALLLLGGRKESRHHPWEGPQSRRRSK